MLGLPPAFRPPHRPNKVSTVTMASNQSTVDSVANQLSTLAAQLQRIRIENQVQACANAELTTQVSAIQSKLEGPMAQMLTGTLQPPPAQVVPPETWQVTTPQGMEDEQPITAKQCAAMIQEALQQRVAPAMGASFRTLSGAVSSTNTRVEVLEAEARSLKLRTAWAERDILSSQIEQAKRTVVCRYFPDGSQEITESSQSRRLSQKLVFTSKVVHSFGGSPHRSWSVMMASSSSQQFPFSQCPTWLSGRRSGRPAIEFDLDIEPRKKPFTDDETKECWEDWTASAITGKTEKGPTERSSAGVQKSVACRHTSNR